MTKKSSFFSNLISFEKEKKRLSNSEDKKPDKKRVCKSMGMREGAARSFIFKRRCFFILLLLLSVIITYGITEITYSIFYVRGHVDMEQIFWFNEDVDPEGHYRFDPDSGFRISQTPARMGAVLPDGQLESMGILQGNDLGFQDDRDFKIDKPENQIRIAVLGDSYTFSSWTDKTWIRIAEDKMNRKLEDKEIFLMNFAIDGGGLGNWAAIVENIFMEKDLELDGIIFASWSCNLDRQFAWRHDGYMFVKDKETGEYYEKKQPGLKIKTVHSWDPDDYPETRKDIMGYWGPNWGWKNFDSETVDLIEAGKWSYHPEFKPYLTIRLIEFIRGLRIRWSEEVIAHEDDRDILYRYYFEEGQLELIFDLAENLKEINLPVLTVSFSGYEECYKKDELFAEIVGSEVITDKESGWPELDIPDDDIHIKNDGHWNQKGAYFFGKTMYQAILDWILEDVVK